MALLKYFAKQNKTNLPDPTGALSREVSSSAIVHVSANNEVKKIAISSENSESKKRGPYSKCQALGYTSDFLQLQPPKCFDTRGSHGSSPPQHSFVVQTYSS